MADAVLPSLHSPKLLAEIGPYIAPEVRAVGIAGENSDVYSLGAILMELLTGRRPSLDTPSCELRAGDPRSEDLESFLRKCLASPDARFASAVDAHRALQQMVTANPFSLYTANLALFLYKLLNPESQSTAPTSDLESTNPVVVHGALPAPADEASASPPPLPGNAPAAPGGCGGGLGRGVSRDPRRRDGRWRPPSAVADVPPAARLDEYGDRLSEARDPFATAACRLSPARGRGRPRRSRRPRRWPSARSSSRARSTRSAAPPRPSSSRSPPDGSPSKPRRRPPALPTPSERIVAAGPAADAAEPPSRVRPAPAAPRAGRAARAAERPNGTESPQGASPAGRGPAPARRARPHRGRSPQRAARPRARSSAQGRSSEEEGERLLRERDYQAAQLAFSRAARLFQQARELTWEERVRQAELAPAK